MNQSFAQFIAPLKLSEVKLKLLTALWHSSEAFPKAWVTSAALLELTGQKYFDRRLRELRDSAGLDLESQQVDGEHAWRLRSAEIRPAIQRTYLSHKEKAQLFTATNYCCAICHKQIAPGIRGLQADHKIPLSRNGGEEIANWQAICNECNVAKRRVCQGCQLTCRECAWAFPEKFAYRILLAIPKDQGEQLAARQIGEAELREFLSEQIRRLLKQS